jgi:hypothetical protein
VVRLSDEWQLIDDNEVVAAYLSPTPRVSIGPYLYENLGEDEFQKLCQVVIANKFEHITCYPVGQKDGAPASEGCERHARHGPNG